MWLPRPEDDLKADSPDERGGEVPATGNGEPGGAVVLGVRRRNDGARWGRPIDGEIHPPLEPIRFECLRGDRPGDGISRIRRGHILHARRRGRRGEEVEDVLKVVRRRNREGGPEGPKRRTPGGPGGVDRDRVAGAETDRGVRPRGNRRVPPEAGPFRKAACLNGRGHEPAVGARGRVRQLESRPTGHVRLLGAGETFLPHDGGRVTHLPYHESLVRA